MRIENQHTYGQDLEASIKTISFWEECRDKTFVISGATGMIGTVIIDMLLAVNKQYQLNITVVGIGRSKEKAKKRLRLALEDAQFVFVEYDLQEASIPKELVGVNIDFMIHGASTTHPLAYATEPVDTITTNVIGAHHLLDWMKYSKDGRFVFLSSVEIYGENRGDVDLFTEEYCGYIDCNTLRAGYPESKRVTEALCQAYHQEHGLDIVIPRVSRVYGPTMQESDSKAIAQFIKKASRKEDIILKSSGEQLYSYTYVVDAAIGILLIAFRGITGNAYNVSHKDSAMTLKEIASILSSYTGSKVSYDIPSKVELSGYSTATKAVMDSEKLYQIGWHPLTSLSVGLKKTVSYMV